MVGEANECDVDPCLTGGDRNFCAVSTVCMHEANEGVVMDLWYGRDAMPLAV